MICWFHQEPLCCHPKAGIQITELLRGRVIKLPAPYARTRNMNSVSPRLMSKSTTIGSVLQNLISIKLTKTEFTKTNLIWFLPITCKKK